MAAEDVQLLNVFKGKRIKLTLKTSSYLGVVQRINPNKSLVLVDVVSCSNGCKIPGSKLFFGREIVNVELTNEADSRSIHDPAAEEHLKVERFQPYRKSIALDDDEEQEEEEEFINFVVIDEFHEKFGTAVMHIKKQRVIGVGADGVEAYKLGRLCWLQIATKNKVYLFDILLLGAKAFKNGLSMILENKLILKVIHDCRAMAGSLIAQFGVKLTNVFDTQVADVMCFYSETGGFLPDRVSTLQEVVSLHLKVPSSQLLSLQMKSQFTKEREMWQQRPCPVPLLKVMALSVIHLQPLRLVLLDALMIDYMTLVDSYISTSHYKPDDLQHISMEDMLEMPRELKQLEQMHRDRQEWATNHYPVTEQGLLARFKPRTPPETSPAEQEQHQTRAKESCDPAASPSSTQADPHSSPKGPLRAASVSSVDVRASPEPAAQAPVPCDTPDLRKEMPVNGPLSLSVGRGRTEVPMMGRGRSFGKEQSSVPALPAMGRAFLLQISQAHKPGESTRDIETPGRMGVTPSCPNQTLTQDVTPQPGQSASNNLPKDTSGLKKDIFTPQPPSSSSLSQSFISFRY
ncbi:piRNA biogenesis protein EXD1 [Sparus aurata]|nr:piRNA biogenesis protein EXD1 [Sparus aurata]